MMHIKISNLLTFLYSLLLLLWRLDCVANDAFNILDISDFTFYYTTYHYMLQSLSFESTTFYIDELQTNITIDFSQSTTLILHDNENNMIELDFLNDNEWDEISTIQPIKDRASKQYIPLSESEYIRELESRTSRSLLQQQQQMGYGGGYQQQQQQQMAYGQQAYGQPQMQMPQIPQPQTQTADGKQINKIFTGITKDIDWDSAENDCIIKHGHLAAIATAEQNNQVKSECNNMGKDWICWIGLKKPFGFWTDDSQAVYQNWIPGSPNNAGGQKDCVEMYNDGKWSDQECHHQRAYVCQKIEKGYPSVARSLITQQKAQQNTQYGAGACGQQKGGGAGCGGCGGNPCRKARRRRRKRRRFRRRRGKRRRSEKRRRGRWRKRMRRIRKRKDKKLKKALRRLKRRHSREARTYAWIADLLHRKILEMKKTGQIAKWGKDRRRMMEGEKDGNIVFIDVVSRCKVIRDFQVCLNHNLGEEFLSVDVKFVDKKMLKERKDKVINYRDSIKNTQKHFHGGYMMMEDDDIWAFNPIKGYLGGMIKKYEMMDWHSFNYIDLERNGMKKYKYGEFDELNDYIHYFDEFQFDFHSFKDNVNNTECSQQINNLPFKMCMKTGMNINNEVETWLFFEKDMNDKYDVNGMYEFQIKEYIDHGFEKNILSFNNNDDWDEIDVIHLNKNNMKWTTKCSYKLIIAKVCIEQFDEYNHRASIKLKSKNTKRDKHN